MTSADSQLALRPPLVTRVFFVVWVLFVIISLAVNFRPDDAGSWAGTIVFASFGTLLAWRLSRQGAFGTDDGRLVVRNLLRTTTVRREDIIEAAAARVRRGTPGAGSGWAVHLRLRTGEFVRLDVTQVPLRGPLRRRLERHEAAVREWVDGRAQPYR